MNIIIIGANSDILNELIKQYPKANNFFLFGKTKSGDLEETIKNLSSSKFFFHNFNALEDKINKELVEDIENKYGVIDLTIVGYGIMPKNNLDDDTIVKDTFDINVISKIVIINLIINNYKKNNYGRIIILGSVAGDRGRAKNFFYGSSMSALNTYVEGLIYRFNKSKINIHLIKLGIVNTKLIGNHKKSFLVANKTSVARTIYKEVMKNKKIIYIPKFWSIIMFILKNTPVFIFKRINF